MQWSGRDAGDVMKNESSGYSAKEVELTSNPGEGSGPDKLMALTLNLVQAYVANHTVPASQLAMLIRQTHRTVFNLANVRHEPAESISVEESIRPDRIVCLECGKTFRSLKRHLAVHHDMTPEQYRAHYSLAPDYPMVSPDYAADRSRLAVSMGLGSGARRRTPKSDAPDEPLK